MNLLAIARWLIIFIMLVMEVAVGYFVAQWTIYLANHP